MRIDKLKEMPHWSYSSLNCFLTCPLKYKFRYIDNAEPERTGSCFPFGRAFHAALSERAKRKGKILGRPQTIDRAKILDLREQGLSMRQIAAELGISAPRVCQIINA